MKRAADYLTRIIFNGSSLVNNSDEAEVKSNFTSTSQAFESVRDLLGLASCYQVES